MTTAATDDQPVIHWERGDYVEMGMWNAFGESSDGRRWIGTWTDYGFTIEITDIQEE